MPTPITADILTDLPGVRHGFFTRRGGVSEGIYASLNCGPGSHDDPTAVRQNRARVALFLGAREPSVITPYQVHSAVAAVIEGPFAPDEPVHADALVTKVPGLAIGILTADCGPVLLADPGARVVAAAHAGWRGAVGGILEATVAKMEEIGARRERIRAVLGPCITVPNYEVDHDFKQRLVDKDPEWSRFFANSHGGGKPHFDLPGFILSDLSKLGLGYVDAVERCTYENESDFYSYRRATHLQQPDYGRQISAILVA